VGVDVASTGDPAFDVVTRVRAVCGVVHVSHPGGVLAIDVGATTSLPERGTGPGASTSLRCPKDQIVVGYRGREGAFVDQLAIRCAPLLVSTTESALALGAVTERGPVGGSGGGVHPATDCGPAEIAVGTRTLSDELFVLKLAWLCARAGLR
jgi:hypothetical protein